MTGPAGVSTAPVLLYDGSCGFCQATVQLVLRHDHRGTLRFAPLQGKYGGAIRSRHPELAAADSVVWVTSADAGEGEQVRVRSAAALTVAGYLGVPWSLLALFWLVPRPVRDRAYDLVAAHRHRVPLGGDRCVLPTPDTKARFLP